VVEKKKMRRRERSQKRDEVDKDTCMKIHEDTRREEETQGMAGNGGPTSTER